MVVLPVLGTVVQEKVEVVGGGKLLMRRNRYRFIRQSQWAQSETRYVVHRQGWHGESR